MKSRSESIKVKPTEHAGTGAGAMRVGLPLAGQGTAQPGSPNTPRHSSFPDGVEADPEYLADARKIIVSALEVGSDLGSEEARAFLAHFEALVKQE